MSRRGTILFLTLGVLWGIPYAFIKVAILELSPEALVLARTGIAALLLLPLALARGLVLPVLRRWKPLALYTFAEIVAPWYFINTAELRLPSSTVGLLLATVPLVGLVVAFVGGRREPMTAGNWCGLAVGLLGVGTLVGFDVAGSDLVGVAELSVAVVGYAIGPAVLARSMPDLPGLGVVAVSLTGAALIYVPIVAVRGSFPTAVPSASVILAVLVLGLVCSAAAFLVMFQLIAEVGPVRMTAITYLNPAVAIAVGALWLGERVTPWTVLGFALVLSGSYLVTNRRAAGGSPQAPAREPG